MHQSVLLVAWQQLSRQHAALPGTTGELSANSRDETLSQRFKEQLFAVTEWLAQT